MLQVSNRSKIANIWVSEFDFLTYMTPWFGTYQLYEFWGLCPVVSGTHVWMCPQSWGFQSQTASLNSYNLQRQCKIKVVYNLSIYWLPYKYIGLNTDVAVTQVCSSQWQIQDFPWGGANLVGECQLLRWLCFKKFVCQNERIWTLGGVHVSGTPPGSANASLLPALW